MTGKILITGEKDEFLENLQLAIKKSSHLIASYTQLKELSAQALLERAYDLVVFNCKGLSYSGAVTLYEMLKKNGNASETPVVLIADAEHFCQTSQEIPIFFQDVITRPADIEVALARLTFIYRKFHRIAEGNLIRCGDLEIDVSRYEVKVAGQKVDLTYTEYELLRFLSTRAGQVFSRDVLLNKVWGYDYFGGARTVDVHIRRLRAKIETGSHVFIETMRNIGYRFAALDE